MDLFPKAFQSDLADLMRWRRDVRRFRSDPVDDALVQECLETFLFAPSVGLSEPWRVIRVESTEARAAACKNFQIANQDALQGYSGEKAVLYAGLKLSGMRDAPRTFGGLLRRSHRQRQRAWCQNHARNATVFRRRRDQSVLAGGARAGLGCWMGLYSGPSSTCGGSDRVNRLAACGVSLRGLARDQ